MTSNYVSPETATSILELIVARFLCKRSTDLSWIMAPKASVWARRHGVALTDNLVFAPDDGWMVYRDLSKCEIQIHRGHDVFRDMMNRLIAELPEECERFVGPMKSDEFRILLIYAGREVYDFFVRDHRFGTPPRGKMFRSNLRGGYGYDGRRTKRPDTAVFALKRKIENHRRKGFDDLAELEAELVRREAILRAGGDPMAGIRPVRATPNGVPLDPDEILEQHRRMLGLVK